MAHALGIRNIVAAAGGLAVGGLKSSLAALALPTDCSASGSGFECHLATILQVLYIAAGALLIVLLVVAAVAYRTYRQNRNLNAYGEQKRGRDLSRTLAKKPRP